MAIEISEGNVTAIIGAVSAIFVAIIGLITKILFDIRGNKRTVAEQILPAPSSTRPPSSGVDPAPSLRTVVDRVEQSTTVQASRLDLMEDSLKRIERELHGLRYGDNGNGGNA
jgi:hypothetical protein